MGCGKHGALNFRYAQYEKAASAFIVHSYAIFSWDMTSLVFDLWVE
tara:strand:- start:453 stop:590 length:138 start_codon:yes stop_codon:yes gene_type:complete